MMLRSEVNLLKDRVGILEHTIAEYARQRITDSLTRSLDEMSNIGPIHERISNVVLDGKKAQVDLDARLLFLENAVHEIQALLQRQRIAAVDDPEGLLNGNEKESVDIRSMEKYLKALSRTVDELERKVEVLSEDRGKKHG